MKTTPDALAALIGQRVDLIDTPPWWWTWTPWDRNIQRMADFARKHQVRWRPHAKMHKSAELALLLQQAGAGACAYKSVRGRSPGRWRRAGHHHHQRSGLPCPSCTAARLGRGPCQPGRPPGVAVDQREGIERLAEAMALSGSDAGMDVLVEIDVGQGRCGVPPGEAAIRPWHWPCRAAPAALCGSAGLPWPSPAPVQQRGPPRGHHQVVEAAYHTPTHRNRGPCPCP